MKDLQMSPEKKLNIINNELTKLNRKKKKLANKKPSKSNPYRTLIQTSTVAVR